MTKNGKLDLIIGPMFSGKSTELIRRINKTKIICDKIIESYIYMCYDIMQYAII